METKFDSLKVQRPVLEILLALSFNNNASFYLKENQNVMNYIRNLSRSNIYDKSTLQRAAAGLLWKLEKETEAVSKAITLNSYKYDVMLSYSHGDKRLCHQIHEQLVKDGFRVWIDREYMHGSTMIAMADAIENSNAILICMSDNYKQSVYCQSEAHYAFERRRRIIPLIVKSHYKPDGWLGIIVSGKLYVDFTKLEFNSACEKLNNEIRQCCRQNTSQTEVDRREKYQHNNSPTMNLVDEVGSQSIAQCSAV
jgi:phosphopantothenate-cysteine ligase